MNRMTRVCLCLALVLSSNSALAQTPPCAPDSYAELESAIESLSGDPSAAEMVSRFDFAAMAVAETCTLADGLESVLESVGMVASEDVKLVVMRGLTQDISFLLGSCGPSGPRVLSDATMLTPGEGQAHFVDSCLPGLTGLAPREALITISLERLLASAVTYQWLVSESEPHSIEIGRLLLGFGLTTAE